MARDSWGSRPAIPTFTSATERAAPRSAERNASCSSAVVVGLVALLALVSCTSTTELETINERLGEIQRQIAALDSEVSTKGEIEELGERVAAEADKLLRSGADLRLDLDTLSSRIGELEAQLQDTVYRIDQVSQQVAATNQELKALALAPPQHIATGEGISEAAGADPETLYNQAYKDYRRSEYELATLGFREYLETYPETELADNALYWIGESYFNQGHFLAAIGEFTNVVSRYPRSEKVPSAILRRGYAYLELGEREKGLNDLMSVEQNHPSSEEAAIARQQLKEFDPGN